ncbi:MAG: NAD(+) synthase [Xanthomonadales bacterium]|nr:NAD(+) synthase [Xanthomonadales bacterium]
MLRIALAQHRFPVGAVDANADRIFALAREARERGAGLIVFPALTLSGGAPDGLLDEPGFLAACRTRVDDLARELDGIACIVGWPEQIDGRRWRAAAVTAGGRILATWREPWPGDPPPAAAAPPARFELAGVRLELAGLDEAGTAGPAGAAPAALRLVPLATPFEHGAPAALADDAARAAHEYGIAVAACNLVGGEDSRVFFGGSLLAGRSGAVQRAAAFSEALLLADFDPVEGTFRGAEGTATAEDSREGQAWAAIVMALGDYFRRNGFARTWLGLSGGIDSALVLCAAVEALGPDKVVAVRLPSRYTSGASNDLAAEQAARLGVKLLSVPIEAPVAGFTAALQPGFAHAASLGLGPEVGRPGDTTLENLQARSRGAILMALANRFGGLVLNTSNKSESAVGYGTIYGDMVGGYGPIQDLYKTEVYAISRWLNTRAGAPVIPPEVITRAPSAELRENQVDQDSLPPYEVLDAILHRHIEERQDLRAIVAAGFDESVVTRVLGLIRISEWKRRQVPPGPKLSRRTLAERNWPIGSGWA